MMKRTLFLRVLLLGSALMVVASVVVPPANAAGTERTAMAIAVPANANLGQQVSLQARLVSEAGPIPKAKVSFVVPATFLNNSADVVVAEATTDSQGLASTDFQARTTGSITVKAQFQGDDRYAASEATTTLEVSGSQQLYVQEAGIQLGGLNAAPLGQSGAWPHWSLSGWPIAAVLIIVWSLYGTAVYFMSRISAEADELESETQPAGTAE
jgi:hypothetical protein